MININYITTEIKKYKNILCINYIRTMEMSSEIINNQIIQLENEKLFKDIEHKNRNCQYARKFYYNNREKIIKEKTEYSKHYEKARENTNLYTRVKYYYNKGYFDDIERKKAVEITKYLINNKLSSKNIEYVKYWFFHL